MDYQLTCPGCAATNEVTLQECEGKHIECDSCGEPFAPDPHLARLQDSPQNASEGNERGLLGTVLSLFRLKPGSDKP